MRNYLTYLLGSCLLLFAGCSDELDSGLPSADEGAGIISLTGEITQQTASRVNDSGFCDGDMMGVYIVDYEGENPGTLLSQGNRGDNVRFTFIESDYRWSSAYDLYWKDKHTSIDVYGYYPFASPDKVDDYEFSVQTDQSRVYNDGTMGGYEASDFLWGKVAGVAPTSSVIRIPFTHRMACVRVTLVEGEGFAEGEWADVDRQVLVCNTVQTSSVDLSTGAVKAVGEASTKPIIPSRSGDDWRAIVVPQAMEPRTEIVRISVDGRSYIYMREDGFELVPGKMHNFTIRVDKKNHTGDYSITLVGESITVWEADNVSHDATSRQYIIIDSTPGGLEQAIKDAGKNAADLKNLKITGEINANDFYFMRDQMPKLQALNLKEVIIKDGGNSAFLPDEIPAYAMEGHKTLTFLILPDQLKKIGVSSFYRCSSLSGSLIIPEGVTEIQNQAFLECRSLSGTLSLPSTLKKLGYNTFSICGFHCELSLPDNLEEIGYSCFSGIPFYGSLRLPEKLKIIGEDAFSGCSGLSGSIEIPQGVTRIEKGTFSGCSGLNGTLKLHEGITYIGNEAFFHCGLRGELVLPQALTTIQSSAFAANNFSGELKIPASVVTIGDGAFQSNPRLSGTLELGENIRSIGRVAFDGCPQIEKLIFASGIESIGESAFENCFGIGSIVCGDDMPPYLGNGVFDGVAKDNFALEVPESAVTTYKTTAGWNEFKRITAHHELVCRPSVANALATARTQTLVIDAEGDWTVDEIPSWCTLSQTSGSKKTELTLTIQACAKGGEPREGDIVFRLNDKDYTHSCHVSQYPYEYGEDEYLALQTASRGNRGGINIVILGDGYNGKDIYEGKYLEDMKRQIEYFFAIEPYKTYRDYFNVYTAIPLSTESGIGTVNTIRYSRFNTTFTGGVGLKSDEDEVFAYALKAPTVTESNLGETLIIMVPNSTDYAGVTHMWSSGAAIAYCPMSNDEYPYDSRGIVQHEAGGHGFGKLGDEYIYHNAFIDACSCACCDHVDEFMRAKAKGWYDNLELTGKMHQVGWSHLIFDPRYSDIVDIYEGGFMHSRGVFRSEQNSCMNNNIPYYSTISRESIVKRIKRYAGETYDFEEFVANDSRDINLLSRSTDLRNTRTSAFHSQAPVIHEGSPLKNLRKRK